MDFGTALLTIAIFLGVSALASAVTWIAAARSKPSDRGQQRRRDDGFVVVSGGDDEQGDGGGRRFDPNLDEQGAVDHEFDGHGDGGGGDGGGDFGGGDGGGD